MQWPRFTFHQTLSRGAAVKYVLMVYALALSRKLLLLVILYIHKIIAHMATTTHTDTTPCMGLVPPFKTS